MGTDSPVLYSTPTPARCLHVVGLRCILAVRLNDCLTRVPRGERPQLLMDGPSPSPPLDCYFSSCPSSHPERDVLSLHLPLQRLAVLPHAPAPFRAIPSGSAQICDIVRYDAWEGQEAAAARPCRVVRCEWWGAGQGARGKEGSGRPLGLKSCQSGGKVSEQGAPALGIPCN